MNFKVEHKVAMTLHGWAVKFDGVEKADFDTMKEISQKKSEHFMNLVRNESLTKQIENSADGYGYAVGQNQADGFYYFAGVNNEILATDSFVSADSDYLILEASGGDARQLFDQLAGVLFSQILPENTDKFIYEDIYLIEVLKNNNPENAEVELWFPITLK
jgi:predicted transcriptional regulator YdeE